MDWDPTFKPSIRPLETVQLPESNGHADEKMIGLTDPGGISDVMLTVSIPALQILSMMDGDVTCAELIEKYNATHGPILTRETLGSMMDHLEQAHFLEGPSYETYYQSLVDDYRNSKIRNMVQAKSLGIVDGSGKLFDEMLIQAQPNSLSKPIRGLVAPHLDYPRGAPCYAQAYVSLKDRPVPDRVVILGTNHFGRSTSIVSTGNDFQTPLGTTRTDRSMLERIEKKCGHLRHFELDHAREHSIELQVAWLQHIFGADQFELVAFLCHDPCGPTGTTPYDGDGVDLADFARVLGDIIAQDEQDTLIIAGADLSHVGTNFGDDPPLSEPFLQEVEDHDKEALNRLCRQGPDAFVQYLSEKENYTRICSAGCIFTLIQSIPDASAHILRYHQAVDQSTQTCVTCSAIAIT